jgi:DNA-directed RNA polymerase specialized sigma24 family protein
MKRSQTTDGGKEFPEEWTARTPTPLEPDQKQWLGELWAAYKPVLLAHATRKIAQLHMSRADYEAADAVDQTFCRFCERDSCQRLSAVGEGDPVLKFLLTTLNRVIRDVRKRLTKVNRNHAPASGRGCASASANSPAVLGGRVPRYSRRRDIALEQVCAGGPSVDDVVIEDDWLEVVLANHGDPRLSTIASMLRQRWRTEEIAERLGLSQRTIERRIALIRSIMRGCERG